MTESALAHDPALLDMVGSGLGSARRSPHVLTAALLVLNLVNFGFNIGASRILEPSSYGVVGSLLALAAVASVPISAIQTAIVREVATAEAGTYSVWGPQGYAAAAAGVTVVMAAAVRQPLDHLFHAKGWAPALALGVLLAALELEIVPRGVLIGEERFALAGAGIGAGALGRLALGLVGASLWGASGALVGTAAGEAATAALFVGVMAGSRGWHGARRHGFAWREMFLSIGGYTGLLLLTSMDTLSARHWLAPRSSGYYVAASIAASIALFLPSAVTLALFPGVAKEVSYREDRRFIAAAFVLVASLSILTAVAIMVAGPVLIRVMFGSGYGGALESMRILAPSYGCLGILNFLIGHHLAHRRLTILTSWLGAGTLLVLLELMHRSLFVIARDALISSGSLLVLLLAASVALERPAASSAAPPGSLGTSALGE